MLGDEKKETSTASSIPGEQSKLPARREETSLRDLFNRFLEEDFFIEPFDFSRSSRLASLFNKQFIPRVDVSETDTEIKVVADVPGVNPDDIDIEVQDGRLRISGSTRRETASNERPYRYERTYGEFSRELSLPSEVKRDGIKAVCRDGVLTVTLPKTESSRKEKILIEKG